MERLKILMIASEAYPFAKSGGLADVVSSLSAALYSNGYDVKIILPRYYSIDINKLDAIEEPMCINMDYGEEWVKVYKSSLPNTDVPIYFIDHEELYGRDGLYGPSPTEEYPDNSRRFSVLCKAAFTFCKFINWIPNIMHSHDWQSALIPALLYNSDIDPDFYSTASVLTIHNLGYQGWFSFGDINFTNLDISRNSHNDGIFNFLRTGVAKADVLTTVSPTYSKEILTPEYGHNLHDLLKRRESDLFGILNGCDYELWNPELDRHISPLNYSKNDLENKSIIKKNIQKMVGLEVSSSIPLFTIITRLVDQKGIGALCGPGYGSLFNICHELNIQIVILGTGESWCEDELRILDEKLDNLVFINTFNNELSHLLEAGADFFLMPSKYEPCGLNQIYSLKYGTLPIVRNTGGLADSVKCYENRTGTGTGFIFDDLTPRAIYDTVAWATWVWYNKKADILDMQQRAMEEDFSWEISANKYGEIYQWALDRKTNRYPRSW
ncbi:glycogen synthase [Thiospirochaeta perfilievii]|uniref:Glycogen synthase n=1 Tax=Thiospirochaeta perfilievii TaxID=252967 RepID=A0A5C1QGS0_9SPIO|nr:glycogen/starch synthase [Thiospirochaeta perfilievii]QEN05814.1 glycogen synthase [Thiospirochaeta perfilievii]